LFDGFNIYGKYLVGLNTRDVKDLTAQTVWKNLKCLSLSKAFETGKSVLWHSKNLAFIAGVSALNFYVAYALMGSLDESFSTLSNTIHSTGLTAELFDAAYWPVMTALGAFVGSQVTASTFSTVFEHIFSTEMEIDLTKEWIDSGACYGMKYIDIKKKGKVNAPHILSADIKSWAGQIGSMLAEWIKTCASFALAAKTITNILGFDIIKKCIGILLLVKLAVATCNYFIQLYFERGARIHDQLHGKFHDVDRSAESILLKQGQQYEIGILSGLFDRLLSLNIKFAGVCLIKNLITTIFSVGGFALGIYLCKEKLIGGLIKGATAELVAKRVYDLFNFVCWKEANSKWITASKVDIDRVERLVEYIKAWEQKQLDKGKNFKTQVTQEIKFEFDGTIGKIDAEGHFAKGKISLKAGDICQLSGKSGEGKSTSIRAFAGLYPAVSGQMTTHENMYFIPQTSYIPRGKISLLDIIQYPEIGSVNKEKKEQIVGLLKKFGFDDKRFIDHIDDKETDWSGVLSGGERQRLALIAAILCLLEKPGMLILDEATSAIDQTTKLMIEKYMKDNLQKSIILFVDHNHSGNFANKVIPINDLSAAYSLNKE